MNKFLKNSFYNISRCFASNLEGLDNYKFLIHHDDDCV